jgi:aminodeoxyfutalosine deaminase
MAASGRQSMQNLRRPVYSHSDKLAGQNRLSHSHSLRIQAEFVVVEPHLVLSNAQILVQDGRVIELCETPKLQPDINLPHSTLLPGFINCHTHLEFSDLSHPLAASGSFPDWIASVVQHRRGQSQSLAADELLSARMNSLRNGLRECQSYGTATVVDIVTPPCSIDELQLMQHGQYSNSNSQCTALYPDLMLFSLAELLGRDDERFDQSWSWAQEWIRAKPEMVAQPIQRARLSSDPPNIKLGHVDSANCHLGLSPHATYSLIHPWAIQRLQSLDRATRIAMHVAESREELEWLEQGTGPFRQLFTRLGFDLAAPRMQVDEALELLSGFDRSLLVHGNYLSEEQLKRVANQTTAIVYCPRTHQHFKHQTYPLQSMVRNGIPILLGTDSRASNPDLSIWRECCQARRLHPFWSATEALAAITTTAAKHLGIQAQLGSLQPGQRAWFNQVATPADATPATLVDRLVRLESPEPSPLTCL